MSYLAGVNDVAKVFEGSDRYLGDGPAVLINGSSGQGVSEEGFKLNITAVTFFSPFFSRSEPRFAE